MDQRILKKSRVSNVTSLGFMNSREMTIYLFLSKRSYQVFGDACLVLAEIMRKEYKTDPLQNIESTFNKIIIFNEINSVMQLLENHTWVLVAIQNGNMPGIMDWH